MSTHLHFIAAIDFTPSCRRALREGIRRATNEGAKITAVYAMDEFLVHELMEALSIDKSAVLAEWEARLRKFVESVETGGVPVAIEVRMASPFTGLVEACEAHHASLMFMGSRGTGIATYHIGAVAAKCVRKAPVDVMLVRAEAPEKFKNILACVDFSPNSVKAVKQALLLAKEDGSIVHCLYVYQSAMAMAMAQGGFITVLPPADPEDAALKNWQKALDELIDPLVRDMPGVEVRKIVDERLLIREAIMDMSKNVAADLVVLGTRGKGTLRHMLMGTTAEKIIHHSPCSIFAVKPDNDQTAPS